ncbi:hypothetical protein PROFUN_04549 [Planoprotostelium fungivorum]|uniref:Uncharacterized protein n=1 Tax=Planoprotostelium fungivorum TaxID=1890364 RepID=A0A2P6NBH7_9EUKA|nr:hypothetical protein PROFUN_04549 [Planoprotostelium fungivorum]
MSAARIETFCGKTLFVFCNFDTLPPPIQAERLDLSMDLSFQTDSSMNVDKREEWIREYPPWGNLPQDKEPTIKKTQHCKICKDEQSAPCLSSILNDKDDQKLNQMVADQVIVPLKSIFFCLQCAQLHHVYFFNEDLAIRRGGLRRVERKLRAPEREIKRIVCKAENQSAFITRKALKIQIKTI